MFEEDFERCFICQTPCKGLYCSSECRLQDKGTPAEPVKAPAPIRLTARLPDSLSPLVRPTYQISPSPRMPAQADNSSSSSISSSPLQSPRTMPSGTDSPQKDIFDLPPPAYPPSSLAFPGSIPVKIPGLMKAKPTPTASPAVAASAATIFPGGASIETLRFGRKPGETNSVTSPNALLPRCACGLPANHRNRPSSKDRNMDVDAALHHLSLGPSVAQGGREKRHVSDGQVGMPIERKVATSGHTTPSLALSSSYLSRSRSDPAPSSPRNGTYRHSLIAPSTTQKHSLISPSRRASAAAADAQAPAIGLVMSRTASHGSGAPAAATPNPAPAPTENRGRSRDRQAAPVEHSSPGLLNHPPDRENAPSRSRHRHEEKERERRRVDAERERAAETAGQAQAPISPSWSRQPSPPKQERGEGVAPSPLRKGRNTPPRSPVGAEQSRDSRVEDRRRAREQIERVLA